MRETRPHRRRALLRHGLGLLFSLLIFLAGLEVLLRIAPGWIGPRLGELGNLVYSRYGSLPGEIYYPDPETGMVFMLPDFEAVNYWNGYFWHHHTDGWGFRNPPQAQDKTRLLLGDSFIYGHGVEEEDTVAHILRSTWDRPAYNMGRQGDCLFQQYFLLRLYLDRFQPREVVLIVFFNDFHDLLTYRSRAQIEETPEIEEYDYEQVFQGLPELRDRHRHPPWAYLYRSEAYRLLRGAARRLGPWSLVARAEAAPPRPKPDPFPYVTALLDWEVVRLVGGYYDRVLTDLQRRCRQRDVRLVVGLLDLRFQRGSDWRRGHQRVDRVLDELCRRESIPYFTTRGLFNDCPECFLPHDGHLTAEGHRRLAAFLHHRVLEPPAGTD